MNKTGFSRILSNLSTLWAVFTLPAFWWAFTWNTNVLKFCTHPERSIHVSSSSLASNLPILCLLCCSPVASIVHTLVYMLTSGSVHPGKIDRIFPIVLFTMTVPCVLPCQSHHRLEMYWHSNLFPHSFEISHTALQSFPSKSQEISSKVTCANWRIGGTIKRNKCPDLALVIEPWLHHAFTLSCTGFLNVYFFIIYDGQFRSHGHLSIHY